jgi:uncharacterized membrane protein YqjE
VEMQEERARAQTVMFLAAGASVFGMLGIVTLTALIACAFVSHLLLALGILTAFYCIGAFIFGVKIMRLLRGAERFTATREQFERDRECLEKKVT